MGSKSLFQANGAPAASSDRGLMLVNHFGALVSFPSAHRSSVKAWLTKNDLTREHGDRGGARARCAALCGVDRLRGEDARPLPAAQHPNAAHALITRDVITAHLWYLVIATFLLGEPVVVAVCRGPTLVGPLTRRSVGRLSQHVGNFDEGDAHQWLTRWIVTARTPRAPRQHPRGRACRWRTQR